MADNLIQVGAVVDLGQYKAGMQEAVATTEATTQQMSAAFQRHMSASAESVAGLRLGFEQTGVAINRHVARWLSDLPMVSQVFAAAFPVIAAVSLLEILGRLSDKITQIANDYSDWTEEAAKAYSESIKAAEAQQNLADRIYQIQQQNKLIGLDGSQRAKQEVGNLDAEIARTRQLIAEKEQVVKTTKATRDATEEYIDEAQGGVYQVRVVAENSRQWKALNEQIDTATADLKKYADQLAILEQGRVPGATATLTHALTKEYEAESKKRSEADKKWQDFLFKVYADTYHVGTELQKQQTEAASKGVEENLRGIAKENDAKIKAGEEQLRIADIQQEAAKAHVEALGAIDLERLDFERALGHISETDYEKQLQQRLAQTYAEARKELELRLVASKQDQAQYARVLAELEKLDDKYLADTQKREQQSFLRRRQQLDQYFQQISSQFNSAISSWITGTETAGQAFSRMFASILESLIGFVEKWIEKKIEMWLMDEILGRSANLTTAAHAASLGLAQVEIDANVAAANAYAAYAAFPPVAAAMAAAAASAVQAFAGGITAATGIAAFERGGLVPQTGLALVHQGEKILPASMSGDGSGLSGHKFVFAPTIQAMDAEGVDRVLTKHQRLFEMRVDKVLRKRGLGGK